MIFRNYMAFLAMLNMLALLQAYVFEQPTRLRQVLWMAVAGGVLGLTYLMRIDLGTFFTLMTVGLIVLFPFGRRSDSPKNAGWQATGAIRSRDDVPGHACAVLFRCCEARLRGGL